MVPNHIKKNHKKERNYKTSERMNFSYVTFAHDDEQQENSLKHTKVFLNKNLFQCYHNNRGFSSFRDKCRYKHFKGICKKNVYRERE